MERIYTDNGILSAGNSLNVLDSSDSLFYLLIPTADMPAPKGAPATQSKTVLTDGSETETEGLQTNAQKSYTFNYHRDNIIQLKKFTGKLLTFMERNADNTGERFTGTMKFSRDAVSTNGILKGKIYITVYSADDEPIVDVRDLMKKTAIITTPIEDVNLVGTGTKSIVFETSENATIVATSGSTSICTAVFGTGADSKKLTITGVAAGNTLITLATSATGEATSYRTIAVNVVAA